LEKYLNTIKGMANGIIKTSKGADIAMMNNVIM
jgi:hypothetical protein